MGLNFPTSPPPGTLYPVPIIPGTPQFIWDGSTWKITAGSGVGPSNDAPLMDGIASPGDDLAYARGDHIHPVPPSFLDGIAYNGMQVNGTFEISQQLGIGVGTNVAGNYSCDGWLVSKGGSGVFTSGAYVQGTGAVPGIPNCLASTTTTIVASPAATDWYANSSFIEGYRTLRLGWGAPGAKPLTIAFWSCHWRPGLYSVRVGNADNTRCCVMPYTHAASNVPQWNVVTFPPCPDGVWNKNIGVGLAIHFPIAMGANYIAPSSGVWYPTNYLAVPGQVNAMASLSDVNRITGVLMLTGNEAPSADRSPYVQRHTYDDLRLAMRYFELGVAPTYYYPVSGGTSAIYYTIPFLEVKRAAPSIALSGWQYYSGGTGVGFTFTTSSLVEKFMVYGTPLTQCNGLTGTGSWQAGSRVV